MCICWKAVRGGVAVFLKAQEAQASDALSSAAVVGYHRIAFQTLGQYADPSNPCAATVDCSGSVIPDDQPSVRPELTTPRPDGAFPFARAYPCPHGPDSLRWPIFSSSHGLDGGGF